MYKPNRIVSIFNQSNCIVKRIVNFVIRNEALCIKCIIIEVWLRNWYYFSLLETRGKSEFTLRPQHTVSFIA